MTRFILFLNTPAAFGIFACVTVFLCGFCMGAAYEASWSSAQ